MEPTTTINTSTTALADPRPHFAAATETLRAVVAGVDPARFGDPTPCTGMTVRQLIDHIGMAVGRTAAAGDRRPLEEWPGDDFSVGDDVVADMDRLVAEANGAWDDDRLAETVTLPWATLSGAETLGTYTNEMLVHGWDLATATGQDPEWDAEAVAVADAVIHQQLPDAERGPMWEAYKEQMPEGIPFEPPFADAVPVPDDATPIDKLVAWNGRQP